VLQQPLLVDGFLGPVRRQQKMVEEGFKRL